MLKRGGISRRQQLVANDLIAMDVMIDIALFKRDEHYIMICLNDWVERYKNTHKFYRLCI